MEQGRPLVAVAPGVMRGARMRTASLCANPAIGQAGNIGEIFIESQVDSGWYAEHFVVGYRHMNNVNDPYYQETWGIAVPWADDYNGRAVFEGMKIGYVGNSCAGPGNWHLDFSVMRLTNVTGAYGWRFQALPIDPTVDSNDPAYGSDNWMGQNGQHANIDPFGWAMPSVSDPWAYMYIGKPNLDDPTGSIAKGLVTDLGAFSIDLWKTDNGYKRPPVQPDKNPHS